MKSSELGDFTQLARRERKVFNQKFKDFVSERPRTLAELKHYFDHIALYCFDYETGGLSTPQLTALENSASTGGSPLPTRLGKFIDSKDDFTLGQLLILMDGLRWQKKIGIVNLKVRLYAATIAILSDRNLSRATRDERLNGSDVARNLRDRLCWALLLLSGKEISSRITLSLR